MPDAQTQHAATSAPSGQDERAELLYCVLDAVAPGVADLEGLLDRLAEGGARRETWDFTTHADR